MSDSIRRAERARQLLEHDLVLEAREHMREALTRALWKRHSYAEGEQAKLDAYVRHYADFFAWFERVLMDGKVAEADLRAKSRIRQIAERARSKF